ncbi:MAG TPA: hypothetical protein VJ691_05445 [Vicinamibacterales bacterium]|nr:hypothetical protein [Vicinamibacterales bacterium]
MIKCGAAIVLALLMNHAPGSIAAAQQPAKPAAASTTTLMVEVAISRHSGDKRLSSTPYEISVVPGDRSSLRTGGDVPVPTTTFTPPQKEDGGKPAQPLTSYSYRTIGTEIDVTAAQVTDGQYRLTLTVQETSIYPAEVSPATTKTTGAPAFRRFSSSNSVVFRDGQSLEYVMATDRISGEVYRVSVKLTVVK